MYMTVNFSDFCDMLKKMDRDNNFSHEGKQALYDYLVEMESEDGIAGQQELDVIALCCEYSEYDSMDELSKAYSSSTEEDIVDAMLTKLDNGHVLITNF